MKSESFARHDVSMCPSLEGELMKGKETRRRRGRRRRGEGEAVGKRKDKPCDKHHNYQRHPTESSR